MTAYPTWTPASRPGIVPLHPLTFGTILGRSFVALRQNPRVLLGFALCVQVAVYLIVLLGVGGVAIAAFVRLDTVPVGSEDFDAIFAGSIAITAIAGLVLGLGATAMTVLVQGVVVAEVSHAVVAEKLTLRQLWAQVRPVIWRLVGYSLALTLAVILLFAAVGAALFGVGLALLPVAIVLGVVAVLVAIPLALWLSTKLMLVPAAIVLEHATIIQAIVRSWTLIRGRFWVGLGVLVVISLAFGTLAQLVSFPFSILTTGVTTVVTPTGDPEGGAIVALLVGALLTQVVTILIQTVAVIVQATATALVYVDCRMRREGLDLDLLAYVERRDAGATGLADPYRVHAGRVLPPRPAFAPAAWAPAAPSYAGAPAAPMPPAAAPPYPPPPSATAAPNPPAVAPPAAGVSPPSAPGDPAATRWTAPGAPAAPTDRQAPWA